MPAGSTPMDRLVAEDPGEQSALFIRPDTEESSLNKGFVCAMFAVIHKASPGGKTLRIMDHQYLYKER